MTPDGIGAQAAAEAERLGAALCASALWSGDECTWQITVPDPERLSERRSTLATAGPTLYSGTAGIAIALGTLDQCLDDPVVRRTAAGAMRHAARMAMDMPPANLGFHSGRVGVGWALARHAAATGEDEWRTLASQVLATTRGGEYEDRGRDVIAGAAGAIPAMLDLARRGDLPEVGASAGIMGQRLLAAVRFNARGWSWPSAAGGYVRDLTGYAHGASGYAHALLELYATTRDREWRYAAEQAMAYEDQFFDASTGTWPDFRHPDVSLRLMIRDGRDELRASLRQGDRPARYRRSHMTAWCHGAPGIALVRARAAMLCGPRYEAIARAALQATATARTSEGCSSSLCHGALGNADILFTGAALLQEPEWARLGDATIAEALARWSGGRWPSGTIGSAPDPTLLLGDAGVMLSLLRAAQKPVPPVLFVHGEERSAGELAPTTLRGHERYLNAFFAETRRAAQALDIRIATSAAIGEEVAAFAEAVRNAPARLRAQAAGDLACFDLAAGEIDYVEDLLDRLSRVPATMIDDQNPGLRLSRTTRLVAATSDAVPSAGVEPEVEGAGWVIHTGDAGAVVRTRVNAFTLTMLHIVASDPGITVDRVVASLAPCIDPPHAASHIERIVRSQLREAVAAGVIDMQTSPAMGPR